MLLYALYILDSPGRLSFLVLELLSQPLWRTTGLVHKENYYILCLHTITLEELLWTNNKSTADSIVRLRHTSSLTCSFCRSLFSSHMYMFGTLGASYYKHGEKRQVL